MAVKSMVAHAGCGEIARQGELLRQRRLRAMEGGVEAGDLRHRRCSRCDRLDRGEVVRLMQRRKWHQPGECLDHSGVDQHWPSELGAAVNHAVPEGDDRPASQKLASHLQDLGGGGMVIEHAVCPTTLCYHGTRSIHGLEMGRQPDILDLAAKQQGTIVPRLVVRELDARRTRVEDGDATGHGQMLSASVEPPPPDAASWPHFQPVISGMSSPCRAMNSLWSNSLSRIACLA